MLVMALPHRSSPSEHVARVESDPLNSNCAVAPGLSPPACAPCPTGVDWSIPHLAPTETVAAALAQIESCPCPWAVVVDHHRPLGLLSRENLRLLDPALPLAQAMAPLPPPLAETALPPLADLYHLQRQHRHPLPVVNDQGQCVGLVTADSLLNAAFAEPRVADCPRHGATCQAAGEVQPRAATTMADGPPANRLCLDILGEIADVVLLTQPSGQLTFVSPNVAAIFGYSRAEVEAMGHIQAVLGGEVANPAALPPQGEQIHLEWQIRDASDLPRDLLITVKRVNLALGAVLYTCRDITAPCHTRAQQANPSHNHSLLAAIPDLLFQVSADGTYQGFITSNHPLALARSDEALVGKTMHDLLPPSVAARQLHYLRLALETGQLQVFEQQVTNGGVLQDEEVRILPNGPDSALFMVRDIGDRKRSERALAEVNALYQQARALAQLGNWEANFRNHTLYWSAEVYHICELDAPQPPSYTQYLERVHPADRHQVRQAYRNHVQHRQPLDLDYRLQLPDGRIKYVHQLGQTTYDADGTPLLCRGTLQDITPRRQAELEREQAETALRQVIEATAPVTGIDFFPALVHHIAAALGVDMVMVSQATADGFKPLAHWSRRPYSLPPLLTYDQVPCCAQALRQGDCCHPTALRRLYPAHPLFQQMELESYLGIQLKGTQGEPLGVLCLLHSQPLTNPTWTKTLLRICATRAAAELERYQTAHALHTLTQELEQRVTERTARLQQQGAQLQHILDTSHDLIHGVRLADGQLEYANRRWCEVMGYASADLNDLTIFDVLHPDCHDRWRQIQQRLQAGTARSICHASLRFVTRAGHILVLAGHINLRLNDSEPTGTLGFFRDVTERQQAERRIQQSEQRFRTLFEAAPVPIHGYNRQQQVVFWNRACEEVYGYSPAEALGQPLARLLPQATQRTLLPALEAWMAGTGEPLPNGEGQRQHRDGTLRQVHSSYIILSASGGEQELFCIDIDLSQRYHIEAALRYSQARLELITDSVPGCISYIDKHQRYRFVNRTYEVWFHCHKNDILGRTIADVIGEAAYAKARHHVERVLAGHTVTYETLLPYKGGPSRYVSAVLVPDTDGNGHTQGYYALITDIHDLKKAELALAESQRFIEKVANASPNVLYLYDIQLGKNVYVNREIGAVLGYTPAQIQAMGVHFLQQLMHPDDWPRYLDYSQRLRQLQDGEVVEFEYRLRPQTGGWRWLYSRDTVFSRDAEGQVAQIIGAAQDVSDRKQAEAALQRSNADLARATRLKDEFLASMSHELRTPLNAILGMAEGLQEGIFGPLNERQNRALRTVERSGTHLLELITDILDVAKIEAGQFELDWAPTNVTALCKSSLAFVRQQARKKNIALHLTIAPALPLLMGDERRLRQVLINLLNNAVKFTPHGGEITLSAVAAAPGAPGHLRLSVQDTGIGIAADQMDRLFQPFVQIDSALNRQYSGTGLGLALAKQVVDLHNGTLAVVSEVGVGSCFTIDLPIGTAPAPAAPAPATLVPPPVSASSLPPGELAVLLVDDNEVNIQTLANYLRAKGCTVSLARNGQQAIDYLQTQAPDQRPDLILMDIQMPVMDGLEATRRIRTLPALGTIPIVALTALAMDGDRERCLAAGATAYLSKPVKLKQLMETIHQLVVCAPPEG